MSSHAVKQRPKAAASTTGKANKASKPSAPVRRQPTARVVEETDDEVVAELRFASVQVANTVRRAALSTVPTLAIDEVVIAENDTSSTDELIAQRLGLLPITSGNMYESLVGDAENRGVALRLDVTCQSYKCGRRIVTSGELVSSDPRVTPVSSRVPIAVVSPGQSLRLVAYARIGIGEQHARWAAATAVSIKQGATPGTLRIVIETNGALSARRVLEDALRQAGVKLLEGDEQA
jgi:DNA-directed RNA polymerase subunit D